MMCRRPQFPPPRSAGHNYSVWPSPSIR